MEGPRIEERPVEASSGLPVVDNPREFMDGFFKSKWYQNAFARFYQNKEPAPEVTMEEKLLVFEQSDAAKSALVDYGVYDTHFKYNPDFYPKTSQESVNTYLECVEDLIKAIRQGVGRDEREVKDTIRYQYHEEAARSLVRDRIVPTEKLGRAMARLILIDKNLDTESSARTPDLLRLERKLGIK